MRKLIVAAAALVWSGATFAGDWHQTTTLRCSECHTMHASRQHGVSGGAVEPGFVGGTGHTKLLIQDGVNETCLACHDGVNANIPDVWGANANNGGAAVRSAGGLNGAVNGHPLNGSYADFMGHTIGSPDAPPGFGGTWDAPAAGFHCGNCHSIHGSVYFRNLGGTNAGTANQKAAGAFTGIGPSYNILSADGTVRSDPTTVDVIVNVVGRPMTPAGAYNTLNVAFQGRGNAGGSMNKYCAVCHGDFHNSGADNSPTTNLNGEFVRHPTTGVQFGATTVVPGTTWAPARIVRPAWNATTRAAASNAEPACLSCHKGHGNERGFALIYPVGGANGLTNDADHESGDATATSGVYPIRNLCIACHSNGSYGAYP